ncbi:hypothetical protein [Leptolyngbya sp. 7M]|uniref:hypothetical protein n=1 Tax=Leptolyngbya sp. 7M TaxID=2812896 RepID=UPI001B8B00E9|nr:hypothetical protein [Leptolyngbya sp. 7M]QYO62958.1 hypothetical protein JVX88_23535 [Leptolyngbya sp. 7M]
MFSRKLTALLVLFFMAAFPAIAQNAASANSDKLYEVELYLLAELPEDGKRPELPSALSGVASSIRQKYGKNRIGVVDRYFTVIAHGGTYDHRSILRIGNHGSSPRRGFAEIRFGSVGETAAADGRGALAMRSFRFVARLPVRVPIARSDDKPPIDTFVNESVYTSIDRLVFAENTPTIVSTLNTSDSDTLFLVMSMRRISK